MAALIFINPLLNSIIKPKLESAFKENEHSSIELGTIKFSFLNSKITLDSLLVKVRPDDIGADSTVIYIPNMVFEEVNLIKLLFNNGFQSKSVLLDSIKLNVFSFPGESLDTSKKSPDIIGKRIHKYISSILPLRLQPLVIDKIKINNGSYSARRGKNFGILSDSVSAFSLILNDIDFNKDGKNKSKLVFTDRAAFKIKNFIKRFPSGYKLEIKAAEFLSKDSSLQLKDFSFRTYISDNEFFSKNKYREDRIIVEADHISLKGLDLDSFIDSNKININEIGLSSFFFEILSDWRKPVDPNAPVPLMPQDLIKKIDFDLKVNRVNFKKGTIHVKELWPYSSTPSKMVFENVNAAVRNISNKPQAAVLLTGQARVAGKGLFKIDVTIPLLANGLYADFKGSLGSMDAKELNSFLTISDLVEIESGKIQTINFTVSIKDGQADGSVAAVYNDLKFKKLSENDLDGSGIMNKVKSFLAKTFAIRSDNPDDEGKLKTGRTLYKRKPPNAFLTVIWFAVRKGLSEIVGFETPEG